jgi:hypothetical protein
LDANVITVPATCASAGPATTTTGVTPTSTGGSGGSSSGGVGSSSPHSSSGVIPLGAPQTGFGGASLAQNTVPLSIGALAILGSGVSAAVAIRRHRTQSSASNITER